MTNINSVDSSAFHTMAAQGDGIFCDGSSPNQEGDWGDCDWASARDVIKNVLEPAPKCVNCEYRAHTGRLCPKTQRKW